MIDLNLPVEALHGVGVEMARKFRRLKVETVGDLLKHYPRRYDDFTNVTSIAQLKPGLVTVKGTIVTSATRRARGRRLTITEAILSDGSGSIKAIWFNQSYLLRQLPLGGEVVLSGKLEFRNNDLALQSPAVEPVAVGGEKSNRIVPVYPETDGLSSRQIRNVLAPILNRLDGLPETLPLAVINDAKLLGRIDALREIHAPSSTVGLERARRRLAFEELFGIILASLSLKLDLKTEVSPEIPFQAEVANRFTDSLEFKLTDAQRKAAWQILQDLERPQPMNRLLEGDVGSGKTVVAVMAAVMAIAAGYQVALMVPTEILARQHADKIGRLIELLGYQTELVLGKQAAASKRQALAAAAEGAANLVIGTHALISSGVTFHNLGLVIIDEQHRFGVAQRQELKKKAGRLPHLLSMTATPIPRSLALTVYGDLDISVIDQLPPGRQPIITKVVKPADRDMMYAAIDTEIDAGRQVFVVCPLIEDSDKLEAKSVTTEAESLKKTHFGHRRIEVIHGKMSPTEKADIMDRYRVGLIDILVATSVIEVGIDIPNASIMLIEGADHFGLAALHQLRGRIGRGQHASFCYLLYDNFSPGAQQRLRAMERTSDGFRLAQIDLELRGPGQIYGQAQHGILDLQMADVGDTKLVAEVRAAAQSFLRHDAAMVDYSHIWQTVNALKAVTSLD